MKPQSPGRILWAARLVLGAVLAIAIAAGSGCVLRRPGHAREARISDLRLTREALHHRISDLVDHDTYVATALAESAEVVVALPGPAIHDLVQEIARNYFDRVDVNLEPEDLEVKEKGELRVHTFLGKIMAGEWRVHLNIHQLRGSLSAGVPNVVVTGTNRLHLTVPAHLLAGSGSATLQFEWDPHGVAHLVCRSYSTTQEIAGGVIPRDYVLKGDFILSASQQRLVADPEFPPDKFVISVDPSDATWAAVRQKLESQDKLFRCGLFFDPDDVIAKLKALGQRGFKVKLPRTLFRPVGLPASISDSVHVGTSLVALSVRPNVLKATPTTFWYSASIKTRISMPDSLARADSLAAMSER